MCILASGRVLMIRASFIIDVERDVHLCVGAMPENKNIIWCRAITEKSLHLYQDLLFICNYVCLLVFFNAL